MEKIIPIWQPVGYSTYQITNAVAEKFNEKAAHTGVLDPLAEGVIIVLLGEERLNKIEYAGWKKTYEFEITLGIRTDSFDGMGLIQEFSPTDLVGKTNLRTVLKQFVGEYEQKVPLYSAVKVKGKKLFMYPKEGKKPPYIPTKKGEIYSMELISLKKKPLDKIVEENLKNLNKIKSGEFRQEEIIEDWKKFGLNRMKNIKLQQLKIKVEISRGMYIRSLSQDICKKLGTTGYVSKLVRTRNGDYGKRKSKTFKKIFGPTIKEKNLTSKFTK
jgi:tRNA pseudouridine55 synthase